MQKQPLVSFIIPIYNIKPEMLCQCIESIMALSLGQQEREIIIVDDGSDNAAAVATADHADDILYIRQRHKGMAAARNIGLRVSTAQFIQFIDGNDTILGAPYEHCLDIARYHNPDIVYFDSTTDKNDVETPFTYNGPMPGSEYMRNNDIRSTVFGYIFERKALGKMLFTEDDSDNNEEFTTQLFLRSERFYSTDSKAYYHSKDHGEQEHKHYNKKDTTQSFIETERMLLHLQSLFVPEADRAALNRRIAGLTMQYLCDIIRYTHSHKILREAIDRLRTHGLYPLPDKEYTRKYKYFRKMIGNPITRGLLFVLIRK